MSTWSLPGYEVDELLGFGASGEVWRARETATGELVALKRLRAGADPGELAALRREAAALSGLDTPYVVRLRGVVDDVLVLDHAAGGSLAALLSRRGCLSAGETVTVAAPLASALAAVHAAGLVHGDVSPANVLFTADGMPLLSDLGGARGVADRPVQVRGTAEYVEPAVARGATPGPPSDVWALGALCHHLLAGTPPHDGDSADGVLAAAAEGRRGPLGLLAPTAPRALVAVIEAALSDDPAARPAAEALAVALQRAQAPAPVRLTGAPPVAAPVPDVRETHEVPRPPRPSEEATARRRPPLAALAAGGLVLLLLMSGLLWSRHDRAAPVASALPPAARPAVALPTVAVPTPPQPGPVLPTVAVPTPPQPGPVLPTVTAGPARPAAPDWGQVLAGLDDVRRQAFAAGSAELLSRVYAAGSPPAGSDDAALAALGAAGETATGVAHQLRSVEQTAYTGDAARLRVVDVLAPQTVRDEVGSTVRTLPGRGEAAYVVELVRQGGGWRIALLQPD